METFMKGGNLQISTSLSLSLRTYDHVLLLRFSMNQPLADSFIDSRCQFIYILSPFHIFFWVLSLALMWHDQIPAYHWPTGHMIRSRPIIVIRSLTHSKCDPLPPLALRRRQVKILFESIQNCLLILEKCIFQIIFVKGRELNTILGDRWK